MENIALDTYNSSPKHTKVLAVLYIIFGGFHAFVFALWLLPAIILFISTGSRAWQNEFARDAVMGSSIFLPFIAALPLITANALLKKRQWSNIFVAASGLAWLLYSLLIVAITFQGSTELGFLLYALPCLALSVYSLWFVVMKRAV